MSTDKFNVHEMGAGNDTHSNFLRRMGYGDLLNRPGRQEMTIDTASMYKSAGDASNALTGAGVAAGGLAGSLVADYTNAGALGRLIMTLAGAGAGGFGGRMLGKHLDETDVDGIPMARRHRQAINAATIGSIGALAGYGTSKYLVGSKNNLYNALGAAAGGGIGALVGSRIGAPDIGEWEAHTEQEREAAEKADKLGLTGDQRNNFIRDYTASIDREKDVNHWYYSLLGSNPTEMDKVIAKYKGEEAPSERIPSLHSIWKVPLVLETGYGIARAVGGTIRSIGKGKSPGTVPKYILERARWYRNNGRDAARLGKLLLRFLSRGKIRL